MTKTSGKTTTFGSSLRRYREAAGFSQEALAARAGLSTRAISDLERGINQRPRYATLELLTKALELSAPQREWLEKIARSESSGLPDASPNLASFTSAPAWPLPPTRLIGREE